MAKSKEQIRIELQALVQKGVEIHNIEWQSKSNTSQKKKESPKENTQPLGISYQEWYTEALPVVRQLLPERYSEFQEQYKIEKRRDNTNISYLNYTISDYLIGVHIRRGSEDLVNILDVFSTKFMHQIAILQSALTRIDSLLSDIKAILQAEFFDDELSVAKELLTKGHLRAAGAVAGVTVERHLKQVAVAHTITLRKKDPTIADLNEALKAASIIDIPDWRFIQRLGDIRNLCVHSKGREPTKDEVDEFIRGADKLIKTLS